MLTVGLDIGTTTICGALLDCDTKQVQATVTLENDSAMHSAQSFEKLQNPARIVELALQILKRLCAIEQPSAIGVTGQMHGILYLDEQGRAVSPLYTWQDGRGGIPGEKGRSCAERIADETATLCFAGCGMATHLYQAEHQLLPSTAVCFCTIADYLAMILSGRSRPLLDGSMAASLGGYHVESGSFCTERLAALGIAANWLPAVATRGCLLGGAIPVATACGDHQASFLAAVPHPNRQVAVNIGTGSQISVFSEQYRPVREIEIRPFFGQGYLYTGASMNGGCVYKALKGFFEQCCAAFGAAPQTDVYETMNRMAQDGEACLLKAEVSLYGSRLQEAKGVVSGLTERSFTPAQLVKAFLAGMAGELGTFYEKMPAEIKQGKVQLALSGNGVRENQALRSWVEKAIGLPSRLSEQKEEAACGAAMAAARQLT